MPQFQGLIFFWKFGIWAKFPDQTWKNKNATLINALIASIFWNKNISCHGKGHCYIHEKCNFHTNKIVSNQFSYQNGQITGHVKMKKNKYSQKISKNNSQDFLCVKKILGANTYLFKVFKKQYKPFVYGKKHTCLKNDFFPISFEWTLYKDRGVLGC